MRLRAGVVAAALALAGVAALAVFPVQAWLAQGRHRADLAAQERELAAANRVLGDRAALLQTDSEVERLARAQHHLVRPGEEAYVILPDGTPPTTAPPPTAAPEPSRSWWSRAWSRIESIL